MKAYKNEKPELMGRKGKGWVLRYDAQSVTEIDHDGRTHTGWEFDSVAVDQLTVSAIVEAIVRERYTVGEEFRMNRLRDAEFEAYSDFVEDAKFVAKVLLGEISLSAMLVAELDRTAAIHGLLADYPSTALKADKLAWLQERI